MHGVRYEVASSDDDSAVISLNKMAALTGSILSPEGESDYGFGLVRPERPEFHAGGFIYEPHDIGHEKICIAAGRVSVGESKGTVNALAVLEEYRGHGIGSRMLELLEEVAVIRGIDELRIANPTAGSVRFYEIKGYENSDGSQDAGVTTMTKVIENPHPLPSAS